MVSFRVALLLIGLAIIAVVYVWGTLGSRRRCRYHFGARLREQVAPRRELAKDGDDHLDQADGMAEFSDPAEGGEASGDADRQIGLIEEEWVEEGAAGQMNLGFQADSPKAASEREIVSLFIEAPPGRPIGGAQLIEAMRDVGMRFGEMGIFHHYGVGTMRAEIPLFSVANMFEPGSFELSTLESVEAKGLVVFAHLPAEVDSPVVFELMLNTAQRLTERFRGELLDDQRKVLGPQALSKIREQLSIREHE